LQPTGDVVEFELGLPANGNFTGNPGIHFELVSGKGHPRSICA
jgi:hypothetical protein